MKGVENTATVIDANNFIGGSGFCFAYILKDLASRPDATPQIKSDWKTIENWLNCTGREMDQADKDFIGRAYKTYFTQCSSPSVEAESIFDGMRAQLQDDRFEPVKLPPEVRGVFDRMTASDKEISRKNRVEQMAYRETLAEKNSRITLNDALSELKHKYPEKIFLTQTRRKWIVGTVLWTAYVIFRTTGSHELLGISFNHWDEDSVLYNLFVPPFGIYVTVWLRSWIQRGKKG